MRFVGNGVRFQSNFKRVQYKYIYTYMRFVRRPQSTAVFLKRFQHAGRVRRRLVRHANAPEAFEKVNHSRLRATVEQVLGHSTFIARGRHTFLFLRSESSWYFFTSHNQRRTQWGQQRRHFLGQHLYTLHIFYQSNICGS